MDLLMEENIQMEDDLLLGDSLLVEDNLTFEESEGIVNIRPSDKVDEPEEDVNEEQLKRTLEIIQNTSVRTKEVYKGLTFIRTKVLSQANAAHLLQRADVYSVLLKMLAHSNEHILNITISILGNLCNHLIMDEQFRTEVLRSKVAGRIVTLLRKISKASIQKRICRFIGNLAQAHVVGRDLHRAGVTYAVVHVLSQATDVELQHLAIRALRWLWQADKHHTDMLRAGVLKAVTSHINSSNPMVEKAALRALVKFTSSQYVYRSIYVAHEISMAGYQTIVDKIDQPVVAVLVRNLSYDSGSRVELCKVGIVPAIINRLAEGKYNLYLVSGLCRMCRESMARASLRLTPNGFSTFLSLLSGTSTKHFYAEILDAITQFGYDQPSLMMMVRYGLIGVLVEKLSEYSKLQCLPHSEASNIPVECMGSPTSPASSWASSPSPPPNYPTTTVYSPRCSPPPTDSDSSTEEPPLAPIYPQAEKYEGYSLFGLDGCVLEVLFRLSYLGTPIRALASKSTITTLLEYLSKIPFPQFSNHYNKAQRTLIVIMLVKQYWNIILDEESVLEIHARLCRPLHQDCWECRRLKESGYNILDYLKETAQSGLGEGEVTYRLTGASSSARITTALSIPHVMTSPNLLETQLFCHGGLRILLETLSTRPEEAVFSFHSLFCTLEVNNPQKTIQVCPGCEVGSVRQESNVNLMVDDGSTVAANREALSHSCPVFEAMFRGGFKESTQSNVRLPDISNACLTHLTRILPEYCSCALPKELPILLEMISITDRFLLPELHAQVVGVVRDSALSPATAPQIYAWSLKMGQQYPLTTDFPLDVVSYLFTSDMLPTHRLQAVTTILSSENKEAFLLDISSIVRSSLSSYTKARELPPGFKR